MDKYIYIILLILFYSFSCVRTKIIAKEEQENKNKIYSIQSIDLIDNYVYIIYAQKNDSIFKIVSKKEKVLNLNCVKITEGKKYFLELELLFPHKELMGTRIDPSSLLSIKGFNIDGIIIEVEDKSHNSLYSSKNLKGICLE